MNMCFGMAKGKTNFLSGHLLKKEIFPDDFVSDRKYTIYFDEFTNVIVQVECIDPMPQPRQESER